MKKAGVIIVVSFIVLVSILAIHNAVQPKPFRWNQSFKTFDKQPYGASVVYGQLENIFPDRQIQRASSRQLDPYYDPNYSYTHDDDEFDWNDSTEYDNTYYYEEEIDTLWRSDELAYLYEMAEEDVVEFNFIGVDAFLQISEDDSRALLQHIYQGNDALIAAADVQGIFLNELSVFVKTLYSDTDGNDYLEMDQREMLDQTNFTVQFFDEEWVDMKPAEEMSYITDYPNSAEVIATNKEGHVIGIELKIGEGTLTYITVPLVFSNYTLLKTDAEISEKLLTNLPNRDTYWATGRWSDNWSRDHDDSPSLLGFILSEESLRWAFYILLIAVLTFFFFEIKRQQRAIPIINPPENVSLKFTETVSRLYQIQKDNREIVRKKIRFLLEYIRNDLNLDTSVLDEKFYQRLAAKSKVDEVVVRQVFTQYHALKDKHEVTDEEFLRFNRLVQNFKRHKR